MNGKRVLIGAFVAMALFALAADACAQAAASSAIFPKVSINLGDADKPADLSTSIKVLLLITVLAIAPSLLVMMTCFTRIVVVISFLRQAIGTHQVPTNQIVVGLGMFLTVFLMMPVFRQIYTESYVPYVNEKIDYQDAADKAMGPLRDFMLKQTREKDLALFVKVSGAARPDTVKDLSSVLIIPAFILSELRTSFIIGFMIYLPFLIIDMVISAVLMSMGMMMLPPVMISLPFKLLIFVLADGWYLIIGSLVDSFRL
jgi:flagellar biosynthesis protein FliP